MYTEEELKEKILSTEDDIKLLEKERDNNKTLTESDLFLIRMEINKLRTNNRYRKRLLEARMPRTIAPQKTK